VSSGPFRPAHQVLAVFLASLCFLSEIKCMYVACELSYVTLFRLYLIASWHNVNECKGSVCFRLTKTEIKTKLSILRLRSFVSVN